jgi:hypothetical protein
MRLLFAIPHYCARDGGRTGKYGSRTSGPQQRGAAIAACITSLHQLFGKSQAIIQVGQRRTVPANQSMWHELQILVVTCGDAHALVESKLPADLYERVEVEVPPMELGFHCHKLLAERADRFDYGCYIEDDLMIRDPWWFDKLSWFNRHVGEAKLLMPNRYEVSSELAYKKCYLDGDLAARVVKPLQVAGGEPELHSQMLGRSIRFVRPLNPHSGCFFLNRGQLHSWAAQPSLGIAAADFIGPLESAATLSVLRVFQLYKPAAENASFFELEHHGNQFIRKIRRL